MIEVKCPSVRALRWTNDSPRCLLELHDNSILLAGKPREEESEREGERERERKNSDLVGFVWSRIKLTRAATLYLGRLTELKTTTKAPKVLTSMQGLSDIYDVGSSALVFRYNPDIYSGQAFPKWSVGNPINILPRQCVRTQGVHWIYLFPHQLGSWLFPMVLADYFRLMNLGWRKP